MSGKPIALLPRIPDSERELILSESPFAASIPREQLREMAAAAGGRSHYDQKENPLRQRALLWVTRGVMI